MRIVSQLVGCNNNGCKSAMMLRVIVHHCLNAARGKHTTRRARLAAHHQYDRQRRLVFGCDKRCRRQIYQRLSRFEMRCRGWNIYFTDFAMCGNIADATVCFFLLPLRDANQIAAFRHSCQVGFTIGVLAEQ